MKTSECVAPVSRLGGDESRSGGILVAVMILVLLLGVLGVAVMDLGGHVGIETVRNAHHADAFWKAEAGLQHARALLRTSASYRSSTAPPVTNAAEGYAASISVVTNAYCTYTIVSTGTSHGVTNVVEQTLRVTTNWLAFDYALFTGGGQLWLRKDTTVEGYLLSDGDMYSEGGYKFNQEPNMVDGTIYDADPASEYLEPEIKPVTPVLTNLYEQILVGAGSGSTTPPVFPTNLAGRTLYYNLSSLTISGYLGGPGTLVVKGNVDVAATASMGSGITIISGGVIGMSKTFAIGSNCVFYAKTGIDLAKDGDMSLGHCALLTPGYITAKKSLDFTGLMFAGGDIRCDMALDLTGCAVAGGAMTIKMNLNALYDESQFDAFLPGMFGENVNILNRRWREIVQ